MKKIFIVYLLNVVMLNSFGQVSIGNSNTPNSEVILDLTNSDGKGLLLPKKYSSITKPLGNIFYSSSKNMIGVVDSISGGVNVVNYLSPWRHTDANSDVTYSSDFGKVIITNTDAANDRREVLEVQDGSIKVNNGDINVQGGKIKEEGNALLPTGVIVMFSGTTAPPGWVLCDGSSASNLLGAPDLKGRFIVGYDPSNADYNTIGNRGGSKIMSHTHGVNPPNRTTTVDGAHTHSGTTAGNSGSGNGNQTSGASAEQNHTHTFTTDSDGNHTHNLNIPNFTSAAASNTENRPPYYALAFIYKL
ncbi:MAG: tail fiber protein [Flavobacteriales bacterium]